MTIRPYRETIKAITVEAFDGVSIDQNIERRFGSIAEQDWRSAIAFVAPVPTFVTACYDWYRDRRNPAKIVSGSESTPDCEM